jgi:hypothetical protein
VVGLGYQPLIPVRRRVIGLPKDEAGAEGVRRADQIAQINGLADAFRADAELSAHAFYVAAAAAAR